MPALCNGLLDEYQQITADKFLSEKENFCQTIYVKNDTPILSSGVIFKDQEDVGLGLYVQIKQGSGSLYICDFHGVSRPADKHDTPGRLQQSRGLIEFFASKPEPKIIGGDFNVFPSNPSIQLFQKNGYQDLIKDYNITNTRNHLVWDRYPENEKQHYADYAFVSNDLRVNAFTVPDTEVSDHLPMVLDISQLPASPEGAKNEELQEVS